MKYFWQNTVPKNLKEVKPDSFLRLQIHNRQKLLDAAVLKHYKPPGTHWKSFFVALQEKGMCNKWIYYAAQRALVTTVAVLPSMDLRKVNIQFAQKVMYNLIQFNLDYMFLKKHNKEKDQSLLGSHFKIQLAQCTDQASVKDLVEQARFRKKFV